VASPRSAAAARAARKQGELTAPAADPSLAPPTPSTIGELKQIPINLIDIPRVRVRQDLGAVSELAYSIGSIGLLHPIQVYRVRDRYRLVAGERRLTAARLLGWPSIDAFVRDRRDDDLLLELVENTQRKWLTDAEEADALIRLVREKHYELKEVAAQAGRSEAYVSKRIRLFEDPLLRQAIDAKQISVSAAEELLALQPDTRAQLLAEAIAGGWEGMRVREAVRALNNPAPAAPRPELEAQTSGDQDFFDGTFREISAGEAIDGLPVWSTDGGKREPGADPARPTDLTRQIQALSSALRNLRPYELTEQDERALAVLLDALLSLARAHARSGRSGGPVFPSLEDAARTVRRVKARADPR
jgi:ParB family chromosome partitioning protein